MLIFCNVKGKPGNRPTCTSMHSPLTVAADAYTNRTVAAVLERVLL